MKKKGFGSLDRVFLLRSVLAALERDIYFKDWADLMVEPEVRKRLPEAFDAATQGIRRALEMLKDLGVTSDRLLPYGLQLVLLGEFHRICPEPSSGTVELLTRWFWVTSFTGWFGGVNSTQAKRALEEIRDLALGKGNTSRWSIWTQQRSLFPSASMVEAPAYAPFCCTWRLFVLARFSATPTWIRVISCPDWEPTAWATLCRTRTRATWSPVRRIGCSWTNATSAKRWVH